MHGDEGLSRTHEMYLKVLYRLEHDNEAGRVRDLARGLGVTASTVSAVLKKLERAGYVIHDHYGTVKLTEAGTRIAECVIRRFEILKAVLIEVLGMDAEGAEVDACTMEHAVSPATVNRMEYLIRMVRGGGIDVQPMRRLAPSISTCSDCEATGSCLAIANPKLPAGAAGRN